jgi:SAM-dependent methyltransferase
MLMEVLKYTSYQEYKQIQVAANKRKLTNVWATKANVMMAAKLLTERLESPKFGICHGARNGTEVKWFKEALQCKVIGTDISPTATEFADMIEWDFHEVKPEWIDACDFIYSNSLDHSYKPQKALAAWKKCLTPRGYLIIEWGKGHIQQSKSDPFIASLVEYKQLLSGCDIEEFAGTKDRYLLFGRKEI